MQALLCRDRKVRHVTTRRVVTAIDGQTRPSITSDKVLVR
jgi:hypothetical protein